MRHSTLMVLNNRQLKLEFPTDAWYVSQSISFERTCNCYSLNGWMSFLLRRKLPRIVIQWYRIFFMLCVWKKYKRCVEITTCQKRTMICSIDKINLTKLYSITRVWRKTVIYRHKDKRNIFVDFFLLNLVLIVSSFQQIICVKYFYFKSRETILWIHNEFQLQIPYNQLDQPNPTFKMKTFGSLVRKIFNTSFDGNILSSNPTKHTPTLNTMDTDFGLVPIPEEFSNICEKTSSKTGNLLKIYFDFAFYTGCSPFRFKKDQRGFYTIKTWKVQQVK